VSSGQIQTHGIAGRYAKALFELADSSKALDAVAEDLGALKAMIADSADLRRVIRSPVISRADQGKALDALLEKAGASELTRRFIGVVGRNRRLFALPGMIEAYLGTLAERRGQVIAEVTSASALDQRQTGDLAAALKRVVGGDVRVDSQVDPDLLGGLVVRVGSRMFDSSLRTKLTQLQMVMKGAG
jgi:F-type H+-transporting ATPase subunit delta